MKFIASQLLLAFVLASMKASAKYPEHYRYQVLVTDKTSSTVTAQSFVGIPHIIVSLHGEEIRQAGLKIEVKLDWVKPFFTAWAHQEAPGRFSLNFWGGLARIPGMNDEGHALVACHELGHVLGGTPRIKIKEFLWSSAEGQSDYFATGICLKKYFRFQHQLKKLNEPAEINGTTFTLCRTSYSDDVDFKVCLNTGRAIEAFKQALIHLGGHTESLDIDRPDRTIVRQTMYDSYPEKQCRIDTLFQGSLCPYEKFPCAKNSRGGRPLCWFYE